ncbi:cell division protein FtsK [Cytobacillus oceanisediminis]|uniref:FtsK/SpoIIIE domain-containing protein n=1 Tax=Cytobacillus oceanisediminis TaxID=665099 RepID=UPI001CCD019F|nr:FtsK/SpoIIIE domain-containing protein [Cytobacillus oceanisediminis]MBZ9536903.1 cell division protein FtsK [Cytobacillus oceanisediminis]
MFFEAVTTTIMGGLALHAHLSKNGLSNDSKKLNKIFSLTGLNVKDGKQTLTTQLVKKRNYNWGTEYRYRIPLGRSFEDYLAKQKSIEAGINTRSVKLQIRDLKELKLDSKILLNIRSLYQRKLTERKEIELSYDGMLVIRVYNEPMPKLVEMFEGKAWEVPIGIMREKNKYIFHDFEKIPHFVLGGATRYGKSNLINGIITSLIKQQPNNIKLHLIDLKGGVELCDYENIKQTVSIAYEPEEALVVLENAFNLMRQLQQTVKKTGKKNVQQAGIKERHFIFIDEVGELNPEEAVDREERELKKQCQKYMSQISRLGAGLGFRLVLATQYPTGDVIPRQCKQNSDAKLCFRVQSSTASRVVLDETGAEQLPQIKGRAIYQTADKKVIVQTPLITPDDIQSIIKPHKREVKAIEAAKQPPRSNPIIIEKTGLS